MGQRSSHPAGGSTPSGATEAAEGTFTNPILPGGFPDPCICRVGEDFYLVNSSFEYFPGLPIHRSKDLVNWEWVGYGLHREEQVSGAVNLVDVKSNDGIHAPSLRYHDGVFCIITTNVYRPPGEADETCINFIITATDIRGPWSQPHVLEGAPGIDPDIFFDDSKVWYVGTNAPANPNFPGEGEIWCQEIDLAGWKLTGERHFLWRGALYGAVFAEGPHLYKHEGKYYLMIAEGGTGVNHAVTIAMSDDVTGPYYPNERNPILTSRHLSYDNWVHSTGHADLFQVPDGRWYMVLLGVRSEEGKPGRRGSNMGRETHLVPVTWEREPNEWSPLGPAEHRLWPVAAPLTGRVERVNPLSLAVGSAAAPAAHEFRDDFDSDTLHPEWNFRRVPSQGTYSLSARRGFLRLYARPEVIRENTSCALLGVRQRESDFDYITRMCFEPGADGVEAGISLFQKDDNYINCTVIRQAGTWLLRLVVAQPGKDPETVKEATLQEYAGEIVFQVVSREHRYHFNYSLGEAVSYRPTLAETAADLILSSGYTGAYLGLYCSSRGGPTGEYADFDYAQQTANPH